MIIREAEEPFEARKRAAGESLVKACEDVFRVEGPVALARATRRSKAWWCKLRAGKGWDFPNWEELEAEVLPCDLEPGLQTTLKLRHRLAWLLLHDPEFLSQMPTRRLPELPVENFVAIREVARRSLDAGDYVRARECLKLVEGLLTSESADCLSTERRTLLAHCLCDLSACERLLNAAHEAIRAGAAALGHFRALGNRSGEASADLQVGLALFANKQHLQAMERVHSARMCYQRLGLLAEAIAASQSLATVLLAMGRVEEAEQELLRLLMDGRSLPLAYRYPILLKLASAGIATGDVSKARGWLDAAQDLMARHPEELAEAVQPQPWRAQYAQLEAVVARLAQPMTPAPRKSTVTLAMRRAWMRSSVSAARR